MRIIKHSLSVLLAGTLALSVALGLAACGGGPTGPSDEELISTSISSLIDSFKNPTQENLEPFIESTDMSTFDEYGIDVYEFFGHMFKHLDYSIDDVQVDGDTATASMTISNVDVNAAVEEAIGEFSENPDEFVDGIDATADDAMQLIMQKVFGLVYEKIDSSGDLTTAQVTITLTKTDGEWDIDADSVNDLVSAMYGGISL